MDNFYLFLLIYALSNGFTMSRHYCSYLRNLREKIIEKITYGWWIAIHTVVDIGSIIGMLIWYNNDKHFWVAVAIPIFIILWYIPLYLKKRKNDNNISKRT
tara:strand:+ start:66 stop:368 length:303 start_codon:yes stop_codon:yes gene_type:complete